MAYFLKKSKIKKGVYLQIYESFYNPTKKQTSHKCIKSIGYLDELIASGIEDPISFYSREVDRMNEELALQKQESKERQIDKSPRRFAGYCLLKNIMNGLAVEKYISLLAYDRKFEFHLYQVLEALVYAQCVNPSSKFMYFLLYFICISFILSTH